MDASALHVLVVDDQPTVCFVLQEALARVDCCRVTTASNGSEALTKLTNDHFDLVITDLRMPIMGGMQLTERIRATHPEVKVIWITAYGSYEAAEDARRLSVAHCLDKPLQISAIRQVVRDVLTQQANDSVSAEAGHNNT
jgi:DNA-binding NtrC family response regulator